MLVDTHAHLYWDSYKKDLDQVIQRSLDASVTTIINVGVDVDLSRLALKQAQEKSRDNFSLFSTIAIHPEKALKYAQSDITELETIYLSDPDKVVAVGECGLDYIDADEQIKNLQRELFKAQIELAKKLNLPIIAHVRDDRSKDPNHIEAWDEVFELIESHPAIFHCYSGLLPTTNYLLRTNNFLVSFAANITYPKNEYLREAAKILPLEKILLETDSPFLAPQSIRGQRNEPSSVKEIAQFIAQIRGISFEQVADQTTQNAKRIFAFQLQKT